ncbi:MAG TPA: dolichyl-phosphate beta-glucosyltransferase [Vicinamibacterales bacterium]|jgi:glycosyltransferase involved in cell wall biosynthesis|nr:dolichyl-phosphate beta-glucosyltransferase [Vicinamibacterales bacterium]
MRAPFLSVLVPAFNEEGRIARTVADIVAELDRLALEAELIVVDDGSTDRTASIVEAAARGDARVALVRAEHAGKGATVRRGMLAARGAWRFLADADLSMPMSELPRFLDATARGVDVLVGSREAKGARRVGEPWARHAIGRVFNWMVKLVVLRGIDDTQCGFKLFSARAAETLFPLQRLDGFGFDVEILFLARRAGFAIREIPVTWVWGRGSKVNLASGARGFLDLVAVRWNQARGVYPPRGAVVTPPAPAGRERQT